MPARATYRDADYEPPWERVGLDEQGRTLTHCRIHDETFSYNTIVRVADVPIPVTLHGQCVGCWHDAHENPKAADVGLLERPDYWKPSPHSKPGCIVWRCTFHERDMLDDEACRDCVAEDENANDHP